MKERMKWSESIGRCLKGYARFRGRASRAEFWWWWLTAASAGALCVVAHPVLGALFWLATVSPGVAVTVRRLHDCGDSGALVYANFAFVPVYPVFYLEVLMAGMMGSTLVMTPFLLGGTLGTGIPIVVIALRRGDEEVNRYGAPWRRVSNGGEAAGSR